MFIVDLSYVAPLEQVDELLPPHVEYLERQYEAGVFLASGRKMPRTGGIILARAGSREELLAVLAQDPFRKAGVARYEITEFLPTMTGPVMASLREEPRPE